jgi:hypothetical protein
VTDGPVPGAFVEPTVERQQLGAILAGHRQQPGTTVARAGDTLRVGNPGGLIAGCGKTISS